MSEILEKQIADLLLLHEHGQLGHAYIFFGDPGIGKFGAAKEFARRIETGLNHVSEVRPLTDTQIFPPDDKGVIGIDAARSIKSFLYEKPFISPRRIAIVDRAQLMTPEAQNAMLKIAEEPPESALLILVMPDPEILWPTLRSRFQKIYFSSPPRKEMQTKLRAAADPRAAKFFATSPAARKDFLKELTEPEDFNFTTFLDALITHLVATGDASKNSALWHAVLELRRTQDSTNLSPRIQLTNLWTLI